MSSAGAVAQNPYLWPLHVAWDAHSIAVGSKKECSKSGYSKRLAYVALYDLPLEMPEGHFHCLLLVNQVAKLSHIQWDGEGAGIRVPYCFKG